jgi:hypothetical protein
MSDETTAGCPERTGETWNRHPCGRPIKRNGMCGIHAAAKDRVEANARWRTERYEARVAADRERRRREGIGANLAALLADATGMSWSGDRLGVRLSFEDAVELLAQHGIAASLGPEAPAPADAVDEPVDKGEQRCPGCRSLGERDLCPDCDDDDDYPRDDPEGI